MHRKVLHPLEKLTPALIDLSRAELRAVRHLGTVVEFEPNRVVCTSHHGDQLGVVLTGELLAGNGTAVKRLGPGDCFGTGSLLTHEGATFAMTRAEVIVYDPRELASVSHDCPPLYAVLMAGCRRKASPCPAPVRSGTTMRHDLGKTMPAIVPGAGRAL
jgi:CRP-like cAMP-binding protein